MNSVQAELKRLYTQLEILRNKQMRHNNPHISKRRGGRKVAHRRFSLQVRRGRHRLDAEQDAGASRRGSERGLNRTPLNPSHDESVG